MTLYKVSILNGDVIVFDGTPESIRGMSPSRAMQFRKNEKVVLGLHAFFSEEINAKKFSQTIKLTRALAFLREAYLALFDCNFIPKTGNKKQQVKEILEILSRQV